MFKKLAAVLLFAAAVLAAGTATAATAAAGAENKYAEGRDYEIRSETRSATPEIREFFSFFCGHCFQMRESFEKVAGRLSKKAKFVPHPVEMIGGDMGRASVTGYLIAKNHGVEDLYTKELFDQLHVGGKYPEDLEFFTDLLRSLGLSTGQIKRDYRSFPIQGQLSAYNRMVLDLKIDAVPELVVNGKYLLKMDNIDTEQQLYDALNYLLDLP